MVSSALDLELDELLERLARIRKKWKDDPGYKKLRATLPKSWPM